MIEVLLALLLWGGAVEPRLILDVEHEAAELPALASVWEGERIAVVADFQIGMWLGNTGVVERAVDRILEERPAAVLIAGDFVMDPAEEPGRRVERAVALVRPITEAGIPAFAVLGNHDHGLRRPIGTEAASAGSADSSRPAGALEAALEAAGVRVLRNEAASLLHPTARGRGLVTASPREALYIIGLGSLYAGEDDPIAALDGVPFDAPRIVVMHHPSSFRKVPAWNAPLAVAGHRHGGQFRIPIVNASWLDIVDIPADGWAYDHFGAPGNRLYITRGIGMSLLPLRINAPPELTFFTLRRAGHARGFGHE